VLGALDWVLNYKQAGNRVDVLNMSFGGGAYASTSQCDASSTLYYQAVRNLANAGVAIFASSGNDGYCDRLLRPACFSPTISVGASYDAAMGTMGWCIASTSCSPAKQAYTGCSTGYAAFEATAADHPIVYSNSATFLDIVAPSTCALTAKAGGMSLFLLLLLSRVGRS
jgi:subtilisin family serine protease